MTQADRRSPDGGVRPPPRLANPHGQSIFPSLPLRRPGVARRCRTLLAASVSEIIDCGDDVRLLACHATQARAGRAPAGRLALLLHGWEGSADSLYVLSLGQFLFDRGFDVVRLNLRDHGDSHHLNEGLFNSSLIEETHRAVQNIADTHGKLPFFIVGFSLGGNFAMRMALRHGSHPVRNLGQVVAISPVLDPRKATKAMDGGLFVYRSYFVKKWKRSLRKKQSLFPHRYNFDFLMKCNTLMEITDRILPRYSSYPTAEEYF